MAGTVACPTNFIFVCVYRKILVFSWSKHNIWNNECLYSRGGL